MKKTFKALLAVAPAILLFSLLFLTTTPEVNAQDEKLVEALTSAPPMVVEQRPVRWLRDDYNAHTIHINGETKEVEKAFEKFISSRYKLKFSNARGWREAPGALLADIIAETVIFAFSVEEEKPGSRLRVIMDLGGVSLDARQHPQAATNLEGLLIDFAREFYTTAYQEVMDEQKKELKSEEKALSKLEKSISKNEKAKKKAEKSLKKAEKEISDLEKEMADLTKEIDEEKGKLDGEKSKVEERKSRIDQLRKTADKIKR